MRLPSASTIAIATPIASTHIRMRVQSPKVTMSATAPMVQKWVRWAIAPNATDKVRAAHSTCAFKASRLISLMLRLSAWWLLGAFPQAQPDHLGIAGTAASACADTVKS